MLVTFRAFDQKTSMRIDTDGQVRQNQTRCVFLPSSCQTLHRITYIYVRRQVSMRIELIVVDLFFFFCLGRFRLLHGMNCLSIHTDDDDDD